MAKFVLVRGDYSEFDKIKDYINKHPKKSYYIASNLMHDYLSSLRYVCVVGVTMDDIKLGKHKEIDLITLPVYNKVFDENVFRVEAIKDLCLKRVEHSIYYDEVIFGLEEDCNNFLQFDVEEI